MYGLFRRLNLWLGHAAMNDMDPVEGPLEPPHHNTDFSGVSFVVRADAPVRPGDRWMGLAVLEEREGRMELVGWRNSLDNWPEGRGMALAIMLPSALPIEFPVRGDGLFQELMKQGYDREDIMTYLGLAADVATPGQPVYLILGLPMRRGADGSVRMHIAVWSAVPEAAEALRLMSGEASDGEEGSASRNQYVQALFDLFSRTTISWCPVMEDRPEIVARRDAHTPMAWFRDKKVLVLGCGALGSWAAELVTRAGADTVDLVDNGLVKPGLIVRQNYIQRDIGANKATALAARLQALAAPGATVRGFDADAHIFAIKDAARFSAFDAVLDCTACHLTQMKLERDWGHFAGRTPPLVSMVTDAKAKMGLMVTLRRNSVGGPWDAYMRLKYRLCVSEGRADFLGSFYDPGASESLFQPEPGCSDPTFIGSAADAFSIASGALNLACTYGLGDGKGAAIAFAGLGARRPAVEVVPLDEMDEFVVGGYRVRIARKVRREVRAWVRENNRRRSPAHETGGLLWGLWDDAVGIIWIFDASGPPPDSRHDPGHFVCGVEGTAEEHRRRFSMSRSASGFIGFWHTHPDMPSQQSVIDVEGMTGLVSAIGENQRRALMLIFGRSEGRPSAGVYVYESQTVKDGTEFVVVGVTQVPGGVEIV